ncbi:MAG: dihydrofolate reductase family protein [Pyrinomonadaceae bacterium]
MRKVVYGGACSLDGYLAREDGSVDWLMFNDEVAELMKDSWSRFDTILMGRKTYEIAMANAPAGAADDSGIGTYVFSTTLDPSEHKGATIVANRAAEFVRSLKAKEGKDISLMGGGVLAATLFEAGVIDEIGFNIHPILLGDGIPSFVKTATQTDLELVDCKPLKNGCVYVLYNVKQ